MEIEKRLKRCGFTDQMISDAKLLYPDLESYVREMEMLYELSAF